MCLVGTPTRGFCTSHTSYWRRDRNFWVMVPQSTALGTYTRTGRHLSSELEITIAWPFFGWVKGIFVSFTLAQVSRAPQLSMGWPRGTQAWQNQSAALAWEIWLLQIAHSWLVLLCSDFLIRWICNSHQLTQANFTVVFRTLIHTPEKMEQNKLGEAQLPVQT